MGVQKLKLGFGFTKLLLGFFCGDWSLSEQIMTYWTNFAKSGNPNGGDLPEWPSYGAAAPHHYLEIGREIRDRADLEMELYQIITRTWLDTAY
jgi:para-nitrobenzyl esterase